MVEWREQRGANKRDDEHRDSGCGEPAGAALALPPAHNRNEREKSGKDETEAAVGSARDLFFAIKGLVQAGFRRLFKGRQITSRSLEAARLWSGRRVALRPYYS